MDLLGQLSIIFRIFFSRNWNLLRKNIDCWYFVDKIWNISHQTFLVKFWTLRKFILLRTYSYNQQKNKGPQTFEYPLSATLLSLLWRFIVWTTNGAPMPSAIPPTNLKINYIGKCILTNLIYEKLNKNLDLIRNGSNKVEELVCVRE